MKNLGKKLIASVLAAQEKINCVLAVFSMIAVALVVSTDLVNAHATIPLLHVQWHELNVIIRTFIWASFVANFAVYCVLSRGPLTYIKNHLLELIVCACWIPHYTEGYMHTFNQMLLLTRLVPMDVLQLIGTLAHAWRVLRFTGQRFRAHPVFMTGAAAVLLVSSSAALLVEMEPQTYHSFWDTMFFSLTTVTTIGFPPMPVTTAGKVITSLLIVIGISLAGVFLGLISEIVRNKLFNRGARLDFTTLGEVQAQLVETKRLVETLQSENRKTNELLQKLLAERIDSPGKSPSQATPVATGSQTAPASKTVGQS